MDLRFAVFDLIARDTGLRALLVNYADRVEGGRSQDGTAADACFLVLEWTDNGAADAPAGSQLLTARAHLPRHRAGERLFLDFVLERLRAALAVGAANGPLEIRFLGASRESLDEDADTITKAGTFEVAPAPRQSPGEALLELAPWPADGPRDPQARRGATSGMN
ncbi:hypothetical protein [Pseudonocardia nigra]|uniref:hypothetical protein n=1 Tax=Pseudonocardia nigra TaxID=1921578 RepID=UPI001C5D6872|nr:hypothetical protein [Pseudonocardia nigra]